MNEETKQRIEKEARELFDRHFASAAKLDDQLAEGCDPATIKAEAMALLADFARDFLGVIARGVVCEVIQQVVDKGWLSSGGTIGGPRFGERGPETIVPKRGNKLAE